jgi:hypothetical protein
MKICMDYRRNFHGWWEMLELVVSHSLPTVIFLPSPTCHLSANLKHMLQVKVIM